MSKLQIYKASAGSGKTFKLTEEYLLNVLSNENLYKNILSVTFTNKATEEMKSRILSELNNLCKSEKSNYRELISKQLNLENNEIDKRAKIVLSNILHNYSYFSVSTIDTFFQSVIQSFVKEIGLQIGFSLELDTQKILNSAIDRLFQAINKSDTLKKWLLKFIELNIEDGKSWNIKNELLKFSNEILKESYKTFDLAAIVKMSGKHFLDSYMSQLQIIIRDFQQKMVDIGNGAIELANSYSLDTNDFSYGKNGVFGHFINLSTKKKFSYGTRVQEAIDDVSKWYKKSSKRISDIESAFQNGLNQLLISAKETYDKQFYIANSARVILDRIYILGILTDISKNVKEVCEDENLFMINDSAHLLQSVINQNDSPFIFEKTGNRFKHFMIDEFQDTSAMQWNNFKPLILNSLAENRQCMIVGDVKQAIYRWRNGDWKILSQQIEKDVFPFESDVRILNHNWRSRKNVIDFNNSIFSASVRIMQDLFNSKVQESNVEHSFFEKLESQIHKSYSDVFQRIPDNNINDGGYIRCQFIEKDENSKDWKETALINLVSEIENLQNKNFRLRDIAILVRTKAQAEQIADFILTYKNSDEASDRYKYDVISDEALKIDSSEVVQILVLVLRYLNSNKDSLSKITFVYKYLRYHNSTESFNRDLYSVFIYHLQNEENCLFDDFLPKEFSENLLFMSRLPLLELAEYIIGVLNLNKKPEDFHFVHAFLNLIHEFTENDAADINSFIAWWDEEGNTKAISTSEDQDAIKILTIHKSKGLEFKFVFVPFCDWKIDKTGLNSDIIWCKTKIEPFNKLENIPLNYSSKLEETIFSNEYFEEKLKTYIDNLNLLYVAFTRAKEGLITFSPYEQKDKIDNIGNLIQNTISQNSENENSRELIQLDKFWDTDTKCLTLGKIKSQNQTAELKRSDYKILEYPINLSDNRLKLRLKHSEIKELSDESRVNKIQEGIVLHNLLEKIETKEDLLPAVNILISEGSISKENMNFYIEKVSRLLEDKVVGDWFSEKWLVKRESPILLKNGKTKIPDRVLVDENKVIVIDYKFGDKESQSHKTQIKEYVACLQQMDYSNIEAYIWYVSIEKIVMVG